MEQMSVLIKCKGVSEEIGHWFYPPVDVQEVVDAFDLSRTPKPEDLTIVQYVLPFDIEPSTSLEELNRYCAAVREIEEVSPEIAQHIRQIGTYFSLGGVMGVQWALNDLNVYKHQGLAELAEDWVLNGYFGEVPEELARHINYETLGSDLRSKHGLLELPGCIVQCAG